MYTYTLLGTDLRVSRVAYGCMNIGGTWDDTPLSTDVRESASRVIKAALETDITLFDHVDIYLYAGQVRAGVW